jgi:sugar phosphate permease
VTTILGLWLALILWPEQPPVPLVAALYLVIGMGGPGSLVAFDVVRTFNPSHALGSASGFVNTGGFLGGFIAVFGVGLVLDAVRSAAGGGAELYSLEGFRLAFLVPVGIIVAGVGGLLVARRRTRRRMFELEGIQIAPLWVALFRARRRRGPSAAGD